MKPPRLPASHPDRHIELEEQLEPFVHGIMEAAREAGHALAEVEAAVASLARNYTQMIEANAETERQIAEAKARRHMH